MDGPLKTDEEREALEQAREKRVALAARAPLSLLAASLLSLASLDDYP